MAFWRKLFLLSLLGCAGLSIAFSVYVVWFVPTPPLAKYHDQSTVITSEKRRVLRAYLASDGRWRLATRVSDVDRSYLPMLIAIEDKRFFSHPGVDVLAFFRAAGQFLASGKPVSGASTITMQVARLLEPEKYRTPLSKLRQVASALRLEWTYSKTEILSFYLTLAPFGGNIESVRAASLIFFKKEPAALSPAESALLVALPQAPEQRRIDRHADRALKARNQVLRKLEQRGVLASESAITARQTALAAKRGTMIHLAPHLSDRVRAAQSRKRQLRTFIDDRLQARIATIAEAELNQWPASTSTAVLVVRNRDVAVRAYVGGVDFFSTDNAGQVDLVRAVRSPGSTLKPFIYGLGFESLRIHPLTIVRDAPVRFDNYGPRNFTQDYVGDQTVRRALISSINTTAVQVLHKVGPERLMARFRKVSTPLVIKDADENAGLAIALGGGGMTLESLAQLYAGLANQGIVRRLRVVPEQPIDIGHRVLSQNAAWSITDILADALPPKGFVRRTSRTAGRRIAYKTGTSYGYRDAWAIGYDLYHTVAVWIGRPDGAPNPGATGIDTAAPILFRVFDLLPQPTRDVAYRRPAHSVLARRIGLPQRLRFLDVQAGLQIRETLKIVFPKDRSRLMVREQGDALAPIPLIAIGGRAPYHWFIDGRPVTNSTQRMLWKPDSTGPVNLRVIDKNGKHASVRFEIEKAGFEN